MVGDLTASIHKFPVKAIVMSQENRTKFSKQGQYLEDA